MGYVEWLRVRNCLRVVAIVMAAFIVIVGVVRVVYWKELSSNDAFINQLKTDPGTRVTTTTLPDGTPRITVDDVSEQTVVTIDGRGGHRHVVIKEPATHPRQEYDVVMGSRHSNEENGIRTTTIDTDGIPIWFFLAAGSLTSMIIATILGAPFARENDGHLEIAALRPQPRYMLALQTVGVDLAGIILANAVTFVGLAIMLTIMAGIPTFRFDAATFPALLLAIAAPAAWYGFIAAATSSLKRGYTAIIGFAWPVSAIVVTFGVVAWPDSVLGNLMHNVFHNIMWIDPLAYMHFGSEFKVDDQTQALVASAEIWRNILMESILFLVYGALAIFQWQRVEA